MKTALQELIERLEEKIKICNSNNLEREAMGMLEAKAIATELLEKERELSKTVEERALELYPVLKGSFATDDNEAERIAYIKGATDNQNK